MRNAKSAGNIAGYMEVQGYIAVGIDGSMFKSHRLIWKLINGTEPEEIDHINHDRADNRLENLRAATDKINRKNRKLPKHNTSGVMGVSWHEQHKKWYARIGIGKRRKFLGLFDSLDEAAEVRKAAEKEFDYHENHGRE